MILCAITSRTVLANDEASRSAMLLKLAARWSAAGVDYIQLREKDLPYGRLLELASSLVSVVRNAGDRSRVLVNGQSSFATMVAQAAGAAGVHLPSQPDPRQTAVGIASVQAAWQDGPTANGPPVISISCHSPTEVKAARSAGASLALFAPVFEKPLRGSVLPGQGLTLLSEACRVASEPGTSAILPVLALGGVTATNASACLAAGAVGIAAIRLFLGAESDPHPAWSSLAQNSKRQY